MKHFSKRERERGEERNTISYNRIVEFLCYGIFNEVTKVGAWGWGEVPPELLLALAE